MIGSVSLAEFGRFWLYCAFNACKRFLFSSKIFSNPTLFLHKACFLVCAYCILFTLNIWETQVEKNSPLSRFSNSRYSNHYFRKYSKHLLIFGNNNLKEYSPLNPLTIFGRKNKRSHFTNRAFHAVEDCPGPITFWIYNYLSAILEMEIAIFWL